MAEELFKKKISKEEKIYTEAVELQKAVSCVLRFERKKAALKGAAKKFDKLGDFRDARTRAEACRAEAAKTEIEGSKKVFEEALLREKQAKYKSDYVDAITEFKRVWKKDAYAHEAREHIQACKRQIVRIENRAAWRRRFTALAIVVAGVFLFTRTPLYPFAKGYVHQQMGEYELALANYEEASGLSWTEDLSGICYYKLGKEKLEQGEEKKALRLFRKAEKRGNKAAIKEIKNLKEKLE